MNYPTHLQNPLLKKRTSAKEKQEMQNQIRFSNMERPISGYKATDNFKRPFSTKEGGETLMHKRKKLQFKALPDEPAAATEGDAKQSEGQFDRGLPHVNSMDRLSSAGAF